MVLLEAMGAGVPVISTTVGAIPETLERGACGVLVPPDDAGAMAAAITDLLARPGHGRALAERAREVYDQRYSREAMGDRYEALYHRLMETA